MGPTATTGYLLQHVSEVLSKQSDQVLQERLGIGIAQYKLLLVLEQQPNAKQNAVAHKLGQTEASVSRQVKLMQQKGLLLTVLNPKSRRDKLTRLTAKGLRLLDESVSILNLYHAPVYDGLSAKQKQQLHESLVLIHQQTCQNNRIGTCNHPYQY